MIKILRSIFVSSESPQEEYVPFAVRHADAIHTYLLSAVTARALSESEVVAAVVAESETIQSSLVSLGWPTEIDHAFERLQTEGVGFRVYARERAEAFRATYDQGIRFSRRTPDWNFALSDDFIKSIERVDKKLQGRVLEAITKIAQSPNTVVGDTVKPLTADLSGLWRYRIIGFPFGLSSYERLPVWATGFMAQELNLISPENPTFLIDCRTRHGQSGSPVIAYRASVYRHIKEGKVVSTLSGGVVWEFLGIYSGRVNDESDLGRVWHVSTLQELLNSAAEEMAKIRNGNPGKARENA